MNTTELFNFHFVDRDIERSVLNDFMNNEDKVALWIKGERGHGKTEFFNYGLKNQQNFKLCYFDIKINKTSVEIISEFIIELQKHCDLDFMSSVKKKYKHFYNNTYKKIQEITAEIFPSINNVVATILDAGYHVATFSDENKDPIDIINNYIKLIISEKNLCICIDNFSRCDIEVAQVFFQIIKRFVTEKNFKSCIITTSEDLSSELKDAIFHNLPWTDIKIKKLEKSEYFYQILNPIFKMETFTEEDLNYIYQKCGGSPKKLSTIISKLLEKEGIVLSNNSKATIDKKILFSILQSDHIKFDDNDFSSAQKWVIFSYLCLSAQISVFQLKEFALYISERIFLYATFSEEIFSKTLLELVENKVLSYNVDETISTYHDLDYIELMDILNESPIKNMFSQYAYEFLLIHHNFSSREDLICYHSWKAQIAKWYTMNFRYGKKLYKQKLFYDAQKIFSRLNNWYHKLNPAKILLIAITSYETGNYQLSIHQLSLINSEQLRFQQFKYYYYFYLGKAYNNVGDIKAAISNIQNALNELDENSKEYVQTLNILHMYCFELPEKLELSRTIFKKIQTTYKYIYPHEWANTMRGCQNFLNDKDSLDVLQEADLLISDELERAYLKTTKGFVLVKLDRMNEAEAQFSDACKAIKRLKIHEYSYAANNLAICYMLKENFDSAKNILLEALFWNRTKYGELVLNTHLMMCALYMSNLNDCNCYYEFLTKYIENNNVLDPIINRKIYMNLAIASSKLNNSINSSVYFEKAKSYIANSSSEWRYYALAGKNNENHFSEPNTLYKKVLSFDPWFLIYAHD